MYFIIYSSYSALTFNDEDINSLLHQSRERNQKLGVTGMLLFFDEKFIQLIEGNKSEVKMLYHNILEDSRHRNVVILKQGDIDDRFFPHWSMGFKTVSIANMASLQVDKELDFHDYFNKSSALELLKILAKE